MATLISNASANLTGAATFAGAEAGALALVLNRNSMQSLANNASVTSRTFTVTNAKVIDAVLLWVRQGAAGSTGTFKVDLQKGGVGQASVTVNRADLPAFVSGQTIGQMVPVLFKLSSTATGDGGSTWTIVLTNSNGTNAVNYAAATASTTNFTSALRTTTAATPAAADDLYCIGELTGAGTHNSLAVTMNSTAATAYGNGSVNSTTVAGGGIHIGYYGSLTYGTSASTNYILRVNGDLWVWEQGPLTIGASGSEIPRTSTAVLEFQQASADGDFGLRVMDNAVWNAAGLSRTSGKNVVQCKLTADVTGSNVLTSGPTALNVTNATSGGIDAGGVSILASTAIDTTTSGNHTLAWSGPSITNTTQSFQVWLERGTGTNNRFPRLQVGNNTVLASVTKGFFADVDLQSGTIGTCTAVGTGTATSASIQAVGGGFLCTIVGKVDGSAATPTVFIAICSAAGTTSFAGANNQALVYEGVQLVTTSSIGDTTFNVDADTGWLSGDQICVASSSRSATDCENFVLSANAGASSLVSHLYPFGFGGPTTNVAGTHHGTSPVQAEVGLLTRNVKIRSTSPTLMTYVYCAALATVNVSWTEVYCLGANTPNKRGIEIDGGAAVNAKSITFCSIHDCDVGGLYLNASGVTALNAVFSNNVMFNCYSNSFLTVSGTITNTDWTISNNAIMKCSGTPVVSLGDHGGTFDNNTISGGASFGLTLSETNAAFISFNGNSVHSCASSGLLLSAAYHLGTFSNLSVWRNTSSGIISAFNQNTSDLYFTGLTCVGNGSTFGQINWSGDVLNITGGTISGDTTFSSPLGIVFASVMAGRLNLISVDMSGAGGILSPHTTNDIANTAGIIATVQGQLKNHKFGAAVPFVKTLWTTTSYMSFEKYNQTAGDHRTEPTYGQTKTDTAIFNTASPSMRMTPNSASSKLESAPKDLGWKIPVSSGNTAAVSVYIYKSKTGDGAAYNGNQPRLIQRANAALGQSSDVVLATYIAGTGSWNQLSANTSAATDDGAFEIIVDCDGTAGWVNIDDLQVA